MSSETFRHPHRVTYSDCTVGNHIYYSRYFELLEAARNEFFRHLGATFQNWRENDTIFPVIECHARYRAPARYDDLLMIELWVVRLEGVRLEFHGRIINQEKVLILEASTVHVCTGLNEKPKRLPESLVESLRPYLREKV